jgi:hypothetical protein
MARGGRREGAGRPGKAPTKTVRVLEAGSNVAARLVELSMASALAEVKASQWYQSAAGEKPEHPEIRFLRIEHRPVATSIGGLHSGSALAPFVIGEVELLGDVRTFAMRLEFGRGGVEIEEERVAA